MNRTSNRAFANPGAVDEATRPPERASLDVLCRRAERLIDSVRTVGEQVDQMFSRPNRLVAEANETARSLLELRDQIDSRLADARLAEQFIDAKMSDLRNTLATVQRTAEALVQRVTRAKKLTEAFGRLIDTSAEKTSHLESAADEVGKARQAIETAVAELGRVQQVADRWADSASGLAGRYVELIAAGNTAASRLRTLTEAGDRLRETVREDVVTLREVIRESRRERIAWEQLLSRLAPLLPATATHLLGAASEGGSRSSSSPSTPATLANRVRHLSDFVRRAARDDAESAMANAAVPTGSLAATPSAVST